MSNCSFMETAALYSSVIRFFWEICLFLLKNAQKGKEGILHQEDFKSGRNPVTSQSNKGLESTDGRT